jgi:hypothetical protein
MIPGCAALSQGAAAFDAHGEHEGGGTHLAPTRPAVGRSSHGGAQHARAPSATPAGWIVHRQTKIEHVGASRMFE